MEPNVFDKVHDIDLKSTMEKSYIDYAMSERNCFPRPSRRERRVKTGSAPSPLFYDRIEQRTGQTSPKMRAYRR